MNQAGQIFEDRIQLNSVLIVLSFVSVLALSSQSAASYSSYVLAIAMLATARQWSDVFAVPLFWLILGLVVYLCSSAFWSQPFLLRDVLSVWVRGLLVTLFVVAFAECQLRGQLQSWLGKALAVVGSLAIGAAILNYLWTQPEDGRLNGLGQLDTHIIAALVFCVVLIFVLDVLTADRSRGWRLVGAVCGLAAVSAIYLSDSRNAWVSGVIGVVVFIAAHRVGDVWRFCASVVAVMVVLSALILGLALDERSRDLVLPRGDSFRPDIWASTIDRIAADGLLFGLGINSSDNVWLDGLEFLHPHNLYLSVTFQGGLFGLAMFLWLIGWVVVMLIRNYDHREAKLGLGILGVALPAYLLDGHELVDKVGSTWFLFWLPVSIALGFRWTENARRY